MTNEQIRVAIAKDQKWAFNGYDWTHCDGVPRKIKDLELEPPNYPEDLNAISQAVATLMDEEWRKYQRALWDCVATKPWDMQAHDRGMIEATALQRSIAYLKTRGIYVEEDK